MLINMVLLRKTHFLADKYSKYVVYEQTFRVKTNGLCFCKPAHIPAKLVSRRFLRFVVLLFVCAS